MRLHKDAIELEAMRAAAAITAEAHVRAMREAKPGAYEYEIEASMRDVFLRRGSERAAYSPIIGSGPNACVLHYDANRDPLRDGDLVLGHEPSLEEFGGGWKYNKEEVFFGGKGDKAHLKVVGEQPEWGPNWDEDQGAGEYPNSYYFYLPRICNHCTNPPCCRVCPTKATWQREEDGVVMMDPHRCIGCRYCLVACPFSCRQSRGRVTNERS